MRYFIVLVLTICCLPSRFTLDGDVLRIDRVQLDRPTVVALGVQMLIDGDDNENATVTTRYRVAGTEDWQDALPLFRVHPEDVRSRIVPPQFAGSIFDLRPATTYDIELHAVDPDGNVDEIVHVRGTTRAVPTDPVNPAPHRVTTTSELRSALASASPGDVITLADGVYSGPFNITRSGTAEDPIVLRGESATRVVLNGNGCHDCAVLDVSGSFVHIEGLTIQDGERALLFSGAGTEEIVVRRVRVIDTRMGFVASAPDQTDFYICDNNLTGRLRWPDAVIEGGEHNNDDGISVMGAGHVVCHNRIQGYGDAMKTAQDGARAIDFYGNDVLFAYDNGVEFDRSAGNVRSLRNRFVNTFATLSFQPIYGGPVYAIRNVVINVDHEQLKFHPLIVDGVAIEPNGILILHNTFISSSRALNLQTTATIHHFVITNNLFVGPESPPGDLLVDWTGGIDDGTFDYNGWYPDANFKFNLPGRGPTTFASFADLQEAGLEEHGQALGSAPFAANVSLPQHYTDAGLTPPNVTLAASSGAIDAGIHLANVNNAYVGAGPDLGALERGCRIPTFGTRSPGVDETNQSFGCK